MTRVVSGLIAVFLLVVYAGVVAWLVWTTMTGGATELSEAMKTVLTLVGGLVSALVIAVLAVTPPAGSPGRAFVVTGTVVERKVADGVVVSYVAVWFISGAALLVAWLMRPDASVDLAAAAKSWLGVALAAAYAYLGLKRPSGT